MNDQTTIALATATAQATQTKFRIHACEPCTVGYHYVWEVMAQSKEEAQAKIEALSENVWDGLPLSEDDDINSDEVRCVEAWEDCVASNGLEFWDLHDWREDADDATGAQND
jgi:hypothetical protein